MTDCESDDCYFFLWVNAPVVVIGANQNPYAECDLSAMKRDGVLLARRRTGGGAVYHDEGNLNFSFAMPSGIYDTARQSSVIFKALSSLGINAERTGRNDFVLGGRKFSGNAYYKGRRRSLHHGTLMVNVDCEAMSAYLTPPVEKLEKRGVKSVKSRVVNLCEVDSNITVNSLKTALYAAFCDEYGCKTSSVSMQDLSEISSIREKYSCDDYLFGKWKNLKLVHTEKTAWGQVTVYLRSTERGGEFSFSTDGLYPRAVALAEKFCNLKDFTSKSVNASSSALLGFCEKQDERLSPEETAAFLDLLAITKKVINTPKE